VGYVIKESLSREQVEAAIHALNTFYAFGAVLGTANEENGHAWATLYAGKEDNTPPDDYGDEATYDNIGDEGWIVGINGGWSKVAATYMGPVLQAKDFFKARDVFLDCVEDSKEGQSDG